MQTLAAQIVYQHEVLDKQRLKAPPTSETPDAEAGSGSHNALFALAGLLGVSTVGLAIATSLKGKSLSQEYQYLSEELHRAEDDLAAVSFQYDERKKAREAQRERLRALQLEHSEEVARVAV